MPEPDSPAEIKPSLAVSKEEAKSLPDHFGPFYLQQRGDFYCYDFPEDPGQLDDHDQVVVEKSKSKRVFMVDEDGIIKPTSSKAMISAEQGQGLKYAREERGRPKKLEVIEGLRNGFAKIQTFFEGEFGRVPTNGLRFTGGELVLVPLPGEAVIVTSITELLIEERASQLKRKVESNQKAIEDSLYARVAVTA
ncbi:MAG TPA: hypothetical protein VMW04_04525 [Patescibacteria group bacterium]|nr:hypothetical protein [Patescibacteria group bacterium]